MQKRSKQKKTDKTILRYDPGNATQLYIHLVLYITDTFSSSIPLQQPLEPIWSPLKMEALCPPKHQNI